MSEDLSREYIKLSDEALRRLETIRNRQGISGYVSNYIDNVSWRYSLAEDFIGSGLEYVFSRMEEELEILKQQNS